MTDDVLIDEPHYSSCLIEAIKAKIKDPKHIHIIFESPRKNIVFLPHVLWHDDIWIYDFISVDESTTWHDFLYYKGQTRKRPYIAYKKYKELERSQRRLH